jgi:hypothetical protein
VIYQVPVGGFQLGLSGRLDLLLIATPALILGMADRSIDRQAGRCTAMRRERGVRFFLACLAPGFRISPLASALNPGKAKRWLTNEQR